MSALLDRVRDLPAAGPLRRRLPDHPAVHVVGGAVRDLLLGGTPSDLDLVVEGDAAAVAAALDGQQRAHDRFGTCTVLLDGFTYDLASARTETYERPGALPDVTGPATLDEDLRRRDFTVNAIALGLNGGVAGRMSAAPRALEDLKARRLRVLHDRSFIDDPTRMLRLVRYASRLDFAIESHTRGLIRPAALKTVSGSRIGTELRLLAREPDPVAAFLCLRDLGLDRAIHVDFGLRDPEPARRALALLPADGRPDRLVLAEAGRDVPVDDLRRLLDHLGFDAVDREAIVAAASGADDLARSLERATRPSEIAQAIGDAGPELVALAGARGAAGPAQQWLISLRHVKLEIDGTDLIAAGVAEGPSIGRGLRSARAAKLDGRAPSREAQLSEAVRAARATE